MRLFSKAPDGGPESGVIGYWLCEFKNLFSIVILHFGPTNREGYHSHSFNAMTLWLKGDVEEHDISGVTRTYCAGMWKYTPRSRFHRVSAHPTAWAISFRGPWQDTWQEYKDGKYTTLTHGRKVIS